MIVGEILGRSARRAPEKTAIVAGSLRMSYRALDAAANRFADALIDLGLRPGDKIAIMAPNLLAYPVAFFGAARAGVVLAHLSVRSTTADIAYMLDKAEVRLLVVAEEVAAAAVAATAEATGLRQVVVIGDATASGIAGAIGFDDFIAGRSEAPPDVVVRETDPVGITFTGGTTGKPKAVLVSHRARFVNNLTATVQFGVFEDDVAAAVTPLFHAAGLFIWFQLVILRGLTCVLLPNWDPETFMDAVEGEGVTAVFMVPTQIGDLIKHPCFDAARLANLRSIDFAGAPMPEAMMLEALEKLPNVLFTEHYGQSEAGPMAVRPARYLPEKLGSVGRVAVGVELAVVDSRGRPLPPGEIGDVVTRGEHLLLEYYKDPEQTAALFKSGDGWLWTGDVGVMDEDGFLTLLDRSKDMIVSGGENIYPKEIENALHAHPAVDQCAVFGIPDDRFGEAPAAHVVLNPGKSVSAEALIAFCAERVARHKRPRLIAFVDELPMTAIGKVKKHLLRAPYWQGRARRI